MTDPLDPDDHTTDPPETLPTSEPFPDVDPDIDGIEDEAEGPDDGIAAPQDEDVGE